MSNRMILVVGAGPGLGASVARRFGREQYGVGLISRDPTELEELATALRSEGITADWASADVTDDTALRGAVERLANASGRVDVVHFNPSRFRQRNPLTLSPDELLDDVRLGVGALLVALQAARPFMSAGGRVTAAGSMAADKPWHEAASLGVQKAGLRNLVRSIDATLASEGIRAVSVTINGMLKPRTRFDADLVADAIHAAAHQDESSWRAELPYDG